MSNRRKVIIALSITLLITVIFIASVLSNETWLSSEGVAIHFVIDNRTNQQIGPFFISDSQDSSSLRINPIEPLSVRDVYYIDPDSWGENAIIMTDNNGVKYPVVYYFEHDARGRMDIRIECATSDGLSGKSRDLFFPLGHFSFEWQSWGTSDCE